jgi:hypothetical protein
MKQLTVLIALLISLPLLAQKNSGGTVLGKLQDSTLKQAMADATVSVLQASDSSSVAFTISDAKGNFEIKDLENGNYRLLITYQSYQNISKSFAITATQKRIDLGNLYMEKKATMLDEVIVEAPPIQVKNDTVEYRAGAFKTKPNATVEDMLKKLPGVQVEKDGTVKAQGETVQKVYVDGKEFFGNDPKLATKNLTADMVESVQVYDDMSDQSRFTKIDDGSRAKAINIKLKKDKKQGMFGRATVGAGTDGRYDGNLSFNRFKGNTQISVIAAGNNVNKQGFSLSDIITSMGGFGARGGGGFGGDGGGGGMGGMNFIGGSRTGGGGGGAANPLGAGSGSQGITRSWNAGLNYRDSWGKKTEVAGSYFFANSLTRTEQSSFRQTFFPNDSVALQSQESYGENMNQNHRFNLRLEHKIDTNSSLLYTPSFTIQHSERFSMDTFFIRSTKPGEDYLAQVGKSYTENERDGMNLNNNLLYRRRLGKIGRTFTLGFNNAINQSDGKGLNQSPFLFLNADSTVKQRRNQDQRSTQETNAFNNTISTSYTEPIGLNKIVEVNYAYTNNQNRSDRKTFDFDPVTGAYDDLNTLQTNYFENGFVSHRIGANFRKQEKKYNFQFGGAVQLATQETESRQFLNGKDTTIFTKQHFTNIFPSANYNYNYGRGKSLRINYRGRTNAPSVTQLQDVPDVSNPTQISTGNPLLKQEFTNNLSVNYNKFNLGTGKFSAINFSFSNTDNKISNSIDTLSQGVQITRPVNLDGAFNSNFVYVLGTPIKKLKGSMLNLTSVIFYNKDVSELYKEKNIIHTWLFTQNVGFNYNYKERLDLGVNASVTYNNARYTVQSNLNNRFWSQTYSVDATYAFKKGLILATDFDYFVNTGRSDGFNQNIPMWNASISHQLFKKKEGEIKLSVFDILNQNQSINRSTGSNYILDTRTVVLRRYFMLSVVYNIRKGSSAPNQNMQMPRMFRKGMSNIRVTN